MIHLALWLISFVVVIVIGVPLLLTLLTLMVTRAFWILMLWVAAAAAILLGLMMQAGAESSGTGLWLILGGLFLGASGYALLSARDA